MSYYRLYTDSKTDHRVKGTSPAKALRELCTVAGLTLSEQNGRYGTTTEGKHVMALTEAWGRVDYPDARTTRMLNGKEVR